MKGTKTWNVPEGTKLPEKIKVYLIRNGESIDSKEVTADDNWAYSWTDLPKYSNDGMSEYTYAVDEEPVAGYNKTVEGAKGFAYNVSYKGNTTVTLNESNLKATVRIINKEKPKDKDKDKDKEEENKKTTTTTTNTTTNTTTSRSVKTGDNTPIALYLIILITAAGAVVLVFVYRKKRRESNK